VQENHPRQG